MTRKQRKRRADRTGINENINRAEIFKYIAVFAILVYVVLLLIYSSGSTKPFEEVSGNLEAGLTTERLLKQNAQVLKRYYGLNSADYEGAVLYTSKDTTSAEEILLVKTQNDRQLHEIKDAVRTRIDSRKNSFENMAPEQVTLLEKAQILVRGRFVFFVVSQDAKEYAELFTGSL